MKILLRTLIILFAVGVVTAATIGAMQAPAVQSWISSSGGEQHGPPPDMTEGEFPVQSGATAASSTDAEAAVSAAASETGSTEAAAQVPNRPTSGERGGHNSGGNLFGLVEVGKNLGIVVIVSLVIAAGGWAARRIHPRRHAAAAGVG